MKFFDTHCHLDFPDFDQDRNDVIAQCDQLGVKHILIPAVDASNWERVIKIAAIRDSYYFALGLHPMFMNKHKESDLDLLETVVEENSPSAIGEIGLDFYQGDSDKEQQLHFFEIQLDVAKKYGLPVVLHVRKAHDDVLKLLRKKKLRGGFVHAYSGSEQQAFQYLDLNFKLGFGGSVTYDRATRLRSILRKIPVASVVLETDAPDIPLSGEQGKRNSPINIPRIFNVVSEYRDEDGAELSNALFKNACTMLGVD